MKNWYSHLIIGLIIAVIAIILLKDLGGMELSAVAIAIAFGSLIPDIDHPTSKIRNSFRIALVFGAIALIYMLATMPIFGTLVTSIISEAWQIWTLSIFIGILLAYAIDRLIPTHRGIVHGTVSAIAYAALCYLAAVILSLGNPQIIAIGGLIGYISHTISDSL